MDNIITYINKVPLNENLAIPDINKVKSEDMNEIKSAVNSFANTGIAPLGATLTYASADSPTFNVTSSIDLTPYLSEGAKILLTQSQALTGYWSFNTNSTPEVGGFTMTNIGTPTYTAGKFGNALTLNGTNQALAITDTALLKPTGPFTIRAWIKTTSASEQFIFQSYSRNANSAGIFFEVINGKVAFHTANNTGTTSGINSINILGNITVNDGNWHYVVATYNNNYGQIYVDGVLDNAGYMLTPVYAATNYVRIGCGNLAGTNIVFWNGQIDDLSIINGTALDEKTIRDKYIANTAQGSSNFDINKWFLIHAINSTTLTLYGGTDFQLANSAITNPRFSLVKSPTGYNGNLDKWSVTAINTSTVSQANPVGSTWYNLGGTVISMPIGIWRTRYSALVAATRATAAGCNCYTTLSTANNAESDAEFTRGIDANPVVQIGYQSMFAEKTIIIPTKRNLFLNTRTTQSPITNIFNGGAIQTTAIKATSIYA